MTTPNKKEGSASKEGITEFVKSLVSAILVIGTIQTVAYQNFNIPSGSMKPNLLIGDFLFVSKFAYGYSHYSLPFSPPLFKGRILAQEPKRGEVVVFRPHFNTKIDFIKRLVGLPGDRIQMREGVLYINDEACPLEKVPEDFSDHLYMNYFPGNIEERVYDEEGVKIQQFVQTLPNGVKHLVIKERPFGAGRFDNTDVFVVPEGHYFMMGDNRDGSDDSRNINHLGFVAQENLIGRAELIYFSTSAQWWEVWKWLTHLRYDRLLKFIR